MKALSALVIALVTLTLCAACGSDDKGVSSRPAGAADGTTTTTSGTASANAGDYVGLTKQAAIDKAEAAGHTWRIGREDDQQFPATLDYNPNRLTFEIDNGKVTSAIYG